MIAQIGKIFGSKHWFQYFDSTQGERKGEVRKGRELQGVTILGTVVLERRLDLSLQQQVFNLQKNSKAGWQRTY